MSSPVSGEGLLQPRPAPRAPAALVAPGADRLWETRGGTRIERDGSALSVQWLDLPPAAAAGLDLVGVERRYFSWVPRLTAGAFGPRWPEGPAGPLHMGLRPWSWPRLIAMSAPIEEQRPGLRRRYRVLEGGLLAGAGGEIAFELWQQRGAVRLLVAVRSLRFRLPAPLYVLVQGRLHERSTYGYLREERRRLRAAVEAEAARSLTLTDVGRSK